MSPRTKTLVTIRPDDQEFDRRIAMLRAGTTANSVLLGLLSKNNPPASKQEIGKWLFDLFGLDNCKRSLVQSYKDFVEIYGTPVTQFFFTSSEDEAEKQRRCDALDECLGSYSKVFKRRTYPISSYTARLKATAGATVAETSEEVEEKPEVANAEVGKETTAVTEQELWDYIVSLENSKQILKELKALYPDVVEDPSEVIEIATKIGVVSLINKIRRSILFRE